MPDLKDRLMEGVKAVVDTDPIMRTKQYVDRVGTAAEPYVQQARSALRSLTTPSAPARKIRRGDINLPAERRVSRRR